MNPRMSPRMEPLSPATLVYAGTIPPQRGWAATSHRHAEHWELITLNAGRLRVQWESGEYTMDRGQAMLYPPGVLHQEVSDGRGAVEILYVGFRTAMLAGQGVCHLADPHGRLRMLSHWLSETQSPPAHAHTTLQSMLLAALVDALQHGSHTPAAWLEPVLLHIRQHLADDLSVPRLAEVAGMSTFHFSRRFRESLGTTPAAYVRAARVAAARDLLAAYSLPARVVAPMVGLRDAAELSRVLHRETALRIRDLRRA